MEAFDNKTQDGNDTYVPNSHTSWAIASTPGVVSRLHTDTSGLATVSLPLTGEKFWVVGSPRPEYAAELGDGNLRLYAEFDDEKVDPRYRWEGVSLNQHTAL